MIENKAKAPHTYGSSGPSRVGGSLQRTCKDSCKGPGLRAESWAQASCLSCPAGGTAGSESYLLLQISGPHRVSLFLL